MNPRDLFSQGLTIPTHENNDLHYIGEALPAPSLVTTAVSSLTPASVGGSAVPAREDHTHNLDFTVDLSNYYTKAEIDTLLDEVAAGELDLSNYYTKAEVDALDNVLAEAIDALGVRVSQTESDIANIFPILIDHEFRISALEEAGGGSGFVVSPIEKDWSFGHMVNPTGTIYLNRYVSTQAFKISYLMITYVVASSAPTVIDLWYADETGVFTVVASATLAADDLVHQYVFSTPKQVNIGDILYPSIHSSPAGTGMDITISIRGFYDGIGASL